MKKHIVAIAAVAFLSMMLYGYGTVSFARYGDRTNIFPQGTYEIQTAKEGFRGVMWCQRDSNIPWKLDRTFIEPCRLRTDEDYTVFGVTAHYISYTFRHSMFYGVRIDIEGRDRIEKAVAVCKKEYAPVGEIETVNDSEVSWRTSHTSVWVTYPEDGSGFGQLYLWGRDRKFPDDSKRPVYLAKPPALNSFPEKFKPRQYVVYRTSDTITIDGRLDEKAWRDAEWTDAYEDHQAPYAPEPWKTTRSRILYDDENIYFCAELQEENVWGQLAVRDTIIYYDNDWEIFLNPTADGVGYYELEINALNVVWDMFLETDYSRAACGDIYYNVEGLEHAVNVQGTLNWHHDIDTGWTVEVKWPLKSLRDRNPRVKLPIERGDVWRADFSRVQYAHIYDQKFPYALPWGRCEDWVWSSTNTGSLHIPEMWGRLIFSDMTAGTVKDRELESAYPVLASTEPPKRLKKGMAHFDACTMTMGPDPTDPERSPAHTVEVPEFWIDRYEVTVEEFCAFLNEGGNDAHYSQFMEVPELCGIVMDAPGEYRVIPGRERYPVVYVSYDAALAYADSKGKVLPTEAMWERAARGTEGRYYPWGNDALDTSQANYDYRYGGTTQIGSFPKGATPDGVHDLCGNVKEWCIGPYTSYPGGRPMVYIGQCEPWNYENIKPPKGVARGGGWTKQEPCMAAGYREASGNLDMGFRCAQVVK